MKSQHLYQACYCEENIWHLAHHYPNSQVIFILNHASSTRLYYQKASIHPLIPVHWDYHVILHHQTENQYLIYDFDTYLPFPIATNEYCHATFNLEFESIDKGCVLRIIEAKEYQQHFTSDRSHMKDEQGNWLQPPPEWPVIMSQADKQHELSKILDVKQERIGRLITLEDWLKGFLGKN